MDIPANCLDIAHMPPLQMGRPDCKVRINVSSCWLSYGKMILLVLPRDVMCSDLIISVSYSLLCISVQGTSNSMRSDLANCSLCKGSGSSYS